MKLRRTVLSVVLVGACVWCMGLVQKAYSEEKSDAKGDCYKPVSPVHDLMVGQEYHYKEVDKQLKDKGKENFKLIRINANILAELCNVNQHQKPEADYQKWAGEARDLAVQLAALAKDAEKSKGGDTAKMADLMREVHTRCTACHDKYQ